MLRQVQDLMRHRVPDGDLGMLVERAISVLLEQLLRQKVAATDRPRASRVAQSRSRLVPAAVRREVWARDHGRCAFVGENARCTETGFLEFHHVEPFARGGATTAENLELRCRSHNSYEATLCFGAREVPIVREYLAGGGWAGELHNVRPRVTIASVVMHAVSCERVSPLQDLFVRAVDARAGDRASPRRRGPWRPSVASGRPGRPDSPQTVGRKGPAT